MQLTQLMTEHQTEKTYKELLANTQDVCAYRGCHNCHFNHQKSCTKVPPRDDARFYEANDCHDWQGK